MDEKDQSAERGRNSVSSSAADGSDRIHPKAPAPGPDNSWCALCLYEPPALGVSYNWNRAMYVWSSVSAYVTSLGAWTIKNLPAT